MPSRGGSSQLYDGDWGTMLEIRSYQMLPDGRSMVETWGTQRFRVLEHGTLDGYMVGRIEMCVFILLLPLVYNYNYWQNRRL